MFQDSWGLFNRKQNSQESERISNYVNDRFNLVIIYHNHRYCYSSRFGSLKPVKPSGLFVGKVSLILFTAHDGITFLLCFPSQCHIHRARFRYATCLYFLNRNVFNQCKILSFHNKLSSNLSQIHVDEHLLWQCSLNSCTAILLPVTVVTHF